MAEETNKMSEFKLEKVILNIGAVGEDLEKGVILLEKVSGKKPVKVKAVKRIPTWSVRPGLEVGAKVTIRGEDAKQILKKLLPALDNQLKEKQIQDNFFSFGIHEYIEIPGVEYIREVGIMGLEATAVFTRPGKHIEKKKVKRGKTRRLVVTKEEIISYLEANFKTKIVKGKKSNDSK
ncbi:50S ribosomal protein L5 [archaeon]|jgi:large subunit ribosomal protein L5|nr:50S ribosomal protein L5 [archaeon]